MLMDWPWNATVGAHMGPVQAPRAARGLLPTAARLELDHGHFKFTHVTRNTLPVVI